MAQKRLKCKQITRLMQTFPEKPLPPPRENPFVRLKKNKAEVNSKVKLLDLLLGIIPHPEGSLTPKSKLFHHSRGMGRASKILIGEGWECPAQGRGGISFPKFLPAPARGQKRPQSSSKIGNCGFFGTRVALGGNSLGDDSLWLQGHPGAPQQIPPGGIIFPLLFPPPFRRQS